MHHHHHAHSLLASPITILCLACSAVVGCGDDNRAADSATDPVTTAPADRAGTSPPVIDPGDGGVYSPTLDPASFTGVIDNPYLPMPIGAHWRYEGESDGEPETIDVTVTGDRKTILEISAFVVRDSVRIDGELVEDTFDWFAQDDAGNVWYLGEDSKEYENGRVVSTQGSWEAGVDGALPGIVMPAALAVGDTYRQEFYAGEAEDMMTIIEVGAAVTVEAGSFDDVVWTKDWNPLEPETIEEKAYARGVGRIREDKTSGGDGYAELVEYSLGT